MTEFLLLIAILCFHTFLNLGNLYLRYSMAPTILPSFCWSLYMLSYELIIPCIFSYQIWKKTLWFVCVKLWHQKTGSETEILWVVVGLRFLPSTERQIKQTEISMTFMLHRTSWDYVARKEILLLPPKTVAQMCPLVLLGADSWFCNHLILIIGEYLDFSSLPFSVCFGAMVKVSGRFEPCEQPLCAKLPEVRSVFGLDPPRTLLWRGRTG